MNIDQVSRAMDATRQSIRSTVDELRHRAEESADWRTYVLARPISSLLAAAACGVALARVLPAVRLAGILRPPPFAVAATWAPRLTSTAGLAGRIAALLSLVSRLIVRRVGSGTRHERSFRTRGRAA